MREIFRTTLAERDLLDIWAYIAEDNCEAADRFLDTLESTFRSLADLPGMGRSRSEELFVPGLRSFSVGRYMVFYYLNETGELVVMRVVHSARDPESLLDD